MLTPLHQLAERAVAATNSTGPTYPIYASAILLATASFMFLLLILPPMIWHFHNRNIGATSLVAWTAILLLFNIINAIIWRNDDIENWYNGVGLCDIEVKIQIASESGRAASLACILRALASVLDTDRATLMKTKAQRRRGYIIDLACCLGFPLLQMLFHYIVQTHRYYIYGIAGCFPQTGLNWVTILLIGVPPLLWTILTAYYAVIILIRLYRYCSTFNSILASRDTTKSRFMRLYIVCIIWILGYIPVECYIFYVNFNNRQLEPFSWSAIHDPEQWKVIAMIPSGGKVVFDRWIWLSCGFVVFVFLRLGRDAVNIYRKNLLAIGLGRCFPSLKEECRGSMTSKFSSFGSKAKMVFKRKRAMSDTTWKSTSKGSHTSSSSEPEKDKYLDAGGDRVSSLASDTGFVDQRTSNGAKNNDSVLSRLTRMSSLFRRARPVGFTQTVQLPLQNLSGELSTVQSAVTFGPRSPTLTENARSLSSEEVLMRREVRQGSEYR